MYILGKSIGQGAASQVYEGIDPEGRPVAIKKISQATFQKPELIQNEIKHNLILNHSNIVQFVDHYQQGDEIFIVTEYCNSGTLQDVIEYLSGKEIREREEVARYYLSQLLGALYYIHKQGYMHRDVKPENILLTGNQYPEIDYDPSSELVVKLADFGFSCQIENHLQSQYKQSFIGSPLFMSPFALQQRPYTSKTDIWSFGVILYMMLFGKAPFEGGYTELHDYIKAVGYQEIDFHLGSGYSAECYDLLAKTLQKDESSRIDWEKLKKHPWFAEESEEYITHAVSQPTSISKKIGLSRIRLGSLSPQNSDGLPSSLIEFVEQESPGEIKLTSHIVDEDYRKPSSDFYSFGK